jgi:hypothetical protein
MMGGPYYWDMPDTDNDEVKGSLGARDSPNTKPNNGLRRGAFKLSDIFYLIDITRIIAYSLFLLTWGI